jgi:cytochrome c oxidase subunit 1
LANFFFSIKKGKKTVQNPWRSNTLEWTAPIKHMHGNWEGEIPEVHRWAYDYSKVDDNGDLWGDQDFTPQTVPIRNGEEEF